MIGLFAHQITVGVVSSLDIEVRQLAGSVLKRYMGVSRVAVVESTNVKGDIHLRVLVGGHFLLSIIREPVQMSALFQEIECREEYTHRQSLDCSPSSRGITNAGDRIGRIQLVLDFIGGSSGVRLDVGGIEIETIGTVLRAAIVWESRKMMAYSGAIRSPSRLSECLVQFVIDFADVANDHSLAGLAHVRCADCTRAGIFCRCGRDMTSGISEAGRGSLPVTASTEEERKTYQSVYSHRPNRQVHGPDDQEPAGESTVPDRGAVASHPRHPNGEEHRGAPRAAVPGPCRQSTHRAPFPAGLRLHPRDRYLRRSHPWPALAATSRTAQLREWSPGDSREQASPSQRR